MLQILLSMISIFDKKCLLCNDKEVNRKKKRINQSLSLSLSLSVKFFNILSERKKIHSKRYSSANALIFFSFFYARGKKRIRLHLYFVSYVSCINNIYGLEGERERERERELYIKCLILDYSLLVVN